MFGLLEKLVELLSTFGSRFLERRRLAGDVGVAAQLHTIVLALQELCLRGERLLRLVDEDPHSAELGLLLEQQVDGIEQLRSSLDSARSLLATLDTELYLELVPFLDDKSGLLTRWRQQAQLSRFSTTTLFFLSGQQLETVAAIGKTHSSQTGLGLERDDFVMAMSESIRDIRRTEERDVRAAKDPERLRHEINLARADLTKARQLCAQLLTRTQESIGPEGLAGLRRQLSQ